MSNVTSQALNSAILQKLHNTKCVSDKGSFPCAPHTLARNFSDALTTAANAITSYTPHSAAAISTSSDLLCFGWQMAVCRDRRVEK